MESREPILSARGFSKTFSKRLVLRGVDLDLYPKEIHGLVGHNGSGKSTFIKILSGYHHPDSGAQLRVAGQEVELPLRPGDARSLGISFVHQDLALADALTILENLRVGRYRTKPGWRIDWRAERRAAKQLLEDFELRVSPETRVGSLTSIQRALVAILRALDEVREAETGVLVLDEPTAYLSRDGVDTLFRAMQQVAASGLAVLFVSHRLEEVKRITHRVTVLRDGRRAATLESGSSSERDLAEVVLGRRMGQLYPHLPARREDVKLRVRDLAGRHVRGVSFDLHDAEIVGVTGLVGMGYEDVPYLLFGAEPARRGILEIGDRVYSLRSITPRRAIAEGIVLLPADRLRHGGAAAATVKENVTLPSLRRHFRRGILRLRREEAHVGRVVRDFGVAPENPSAPFATLSGGNQQKALVAKWFEISPRVLLLHEPTQGVDIGARAQIFELISRAAADGCSVLIAGTEYEDLAHLCDRVFIFRNGAVVAEIAGPQLTADRIVEACYVETSDHSRPRSSSVGRDP